MKRWMITAATIMAILSTGCILHATHYTASDGSTVYVGELYSEGNSYDQSARVQGKFFDAAGNLIATKDGPICLGVNQKNVIPFKVVLPAGTAPADHVEWSVVGAPADPHLATGLEADVLSTVSVDLPPLLSNSKQYSGMLRNTSSNDYVGGSVCVAWLGANGDVLREQVTDATALRLSAGSSVPFVLLEQVPPEATHMAFFFDAGVAPPGGSLPSVIDIPSSNLRHTSNQGNVGGFVFFGATEVFNSSSTAIHAPVVSVLAKDGAGETLVGESLPFCPFDIPAGAMSFAQYGVIAGNSGIASAPAVSMQAIASTSNPAVSLSTSGVSMSKSGTTVTVTGTVRNTSGKTLKSVGVCAGVYDSSGNVIGIGGGSPVLPSGGLPANASVSFSEEALAPSTSAVSVKAVAVGVGQ